MYKFQNRAVGEDETQDLLTEKFSVQIATQEL